MAKADSADDKSVYCSACFYADNKCLIAGDRAAAAAYFQKCLSTGPNDAAEYKMAKAKLRLLGQKKN